MVFAFGGIKWNVMEFELPKREDFTKVRIVAENFDVTLTLEDEQDYYILQMLIERSKKPK